jgi:hypothetical protein
MAQIRMCTAQHASMTREYGTLGCQGSAVRKTTLSTPVRLVAWGRPGPSAAPSRRSTPQACAGRPARRRGAPCSAAARIGYGNALPTHGATNAPMAGTGARKRRGARNGTRARHPHATASGGMAGYPGGTQRAQRVRGAQARGTPVLTPNSHRTRGRGGFAVRWESAPPPNRLRISSEAAQGQPRSDCKNRNNCHNGNRATENKTTARVRKPAVRASAADRSGV